MNADDKRKSERFVSFAHVKIINSDVYGYITNVSYTGIKTLLNTEKVSCELGCQYTLELYAPELDLPRFSCSAILRWVKTIDTYHHEAGFEINNFVNDTAKLLYGKLIENYMRFS